MLPVAISEIEAPSIAAPRPAAAQPVCRNDLVEIDGEPVADLGRLGDASSSLLTGEAVDVQPCDGIARSHLAAGRIASRPPMGLTTGIDVDRIVLAQCASHRSPRPAATHGVDRPRPHDAHGHRDGLPDRVLVDPRRGLQRRLEGDGRRPDLGAPRQISGGFNGWRLPASTSPVTVTMTWTPQRTMWIGMVAGCAWPSWPARC